MTKISGEKLVSTIEYHIIERAGHRVGIIGLAEYGWFGSLNCIDPDDIFYEDFLTCSNRLSSMLREEEGCDIVIALTHMRQPNDERLAKLSTGIDLILGGHDHVRIYHLLTLRFMSQNG